MKKRFMVLAVTGVMSAAMLAGCGEKTAPTQNPVAQTTPAATEAPETTEATEAPKGEGAENPGEVGMINPWRDATEEEANELIPRLFTAPEGAEVLSWMILDDAKEANGEEGPLVDLQFSLDGNIFDARAQVTGDDYLDLSGLYYDWTAEDDVTLANWGGGNMKGTAYRNINDNGMVDLITWYDVEIGISYSLSIAAEDLDGFDIRAIHLGDDLQRSIRIVKQNADPVRLTDVQQICHFHFQFLHDRRAMDACRLTGLICFLRCRKLFPVVRRDHFGIPAMLVVNHFV